MNFLLSRYVNLILYYIRHVTFVACLFVCTLWTYIIRIHVLKDIAY
nr:MAG TPA: hypothetical protein [Caudoviricetes sp.]